MLGRILAAAAAGFALMAGTAGAAPDAVTLGLFAEPAGLDPTAGADPATDEIVYANIFQGLTRFGPDGSVLPCLAESWRISEDGRVYTFRLRAGVKFHDGSDFDAGDVVFSLDRARADDSANAQKALFYAIETVEADDPLTVRVTLESPVGAFLSNMAWPDAAMLAPETADKAAETPIGTGPFRLYQWARGDHVALDAYPDYWGEKPALARASFHFFADAASARAALLAGEIDAIPNFPDLAELAGLAGDLRFRLLNGTTEGETILAMNNKTEALSNIKLRQAIAHAIDRQALIDGAMSGFGTPIGSHFAPHGPDYVDLTGLSAHDPAKSRALLAEAGIDGLTLRLALPPPGYARRSGPIIALQLAAIGIVVEIVEMDWETWRETVFKGRDFDLTVVSHTEPDDINIYARPDYYFQYGDIDFAALMDRLTVTANPAERSTILRDAQRMIAADYVNGFLFQLPRAGIADARLEGLWPNAPLAANDLTGVRWAE